MSRAVLHLAGALAGLVLLLTAPARAVDLIPRDVFFGNPSRTAVRLSPSGDQVSYVAPRDGVLNIWVQPIDGGPAQPVTSSTDRPITSYFWMPDGAHLVYLLDDGGDENYHLHAIAPTGGAARDLTPIAGVQARVIAVDPAHPSTLLVGLNDRVPQLHDVYRIDVASGARELVFQNDLGFVGVNADAAFDIRMGTRFRRDGGMTVLVRDAVDAPWYELVRWSAEDAAASAPIGFSRDGRSVYLMDARTHDTGRLCAYTVHADGTTSYETLAEDPRSDMADVVLDPATGHPQAVAFEYERRTWQILDPGIAGAWRDAQMIEDGEMSLVARDQHDSTWIVGFARADGPYRYHVLDRATGESRFLFSNRPELDDLELAAMQSVVIPARDGLPMVSYLTLPTGDLLSRHLPMVLLVHGGPWARDRWGYHPFHQWLANRGYAVLSVNFRGSSGFGKRFLNAGNGEWAGKMHDDLIDAVNWAVENQVADPDRVAIMGGSYGGYAALVGLTFTPEFFAAGIDIVGPSSVRTLLESIPPYWEPARAMFEQRVGASEPPEILDSISPLHRVDAIVRPLLIGQGANDPRVKVGESEQIVAAMRERAIPVTYVVFPDEGHGFRRPENNLAFVSIAEAFLAEHLGGRAEPIESTVRRSSAQVPAGAELIKGLDLPDSDSTD